MRAQCEVRVRVRVRVVCASMCALCARACACCVREHVRVVREHVHVVCVSAAALSRPGKIFLLCFFAASAKATVSP